MMSKTEQWIRPGRDKVIALLHGIGAKSALGYWDKFLQVLQTDEKLQDFSLFVWKYPTHVRPGRLKDIASTVMKRTLRGTAPNIKDLGAVWGTTYHTQFHDYQEVILVCHSMGGLVVKSWIIDTLERGQSTTLETLRHIAFYATPHNGAPITTLANWNKQLRDMQLDSPFIEDIGSRWHEHVVAWKDKVPGPEDHLYNRYIPHLVIAGLIDYVVPSNYATIRGMPLTSVQGDHSEVIQPINADDTRYRVWQGDMQKALQTESLSIPPSWLAPHPTKNVLQTTTLAGSDAQKALTVFFSYAPEDEKFVKELEKHLSMLKRQRLISTWYARRIVPGTDWTREIAQQLEQTSIILLLVSSDFLASNYCYEMQMQQALQRHEAGETRVIPIIVRPCDWKNAPFAHLQALPTAAKAVTIWNNQDEAWLDVAQGIRKALEEFLKNSSRKEANVSEEHQPIQERAKPTSLDPFPPIWNVPYRYTTFFTGRDHVVEQLFKNFTTVPASGIIPVQALTGLGGLGKTQTAVAYAFRYRKQYQTVLWINAETEGDLVTGFTSMAKLLALPRTNLQHRESVLEGIQRWLSSTSDWLLILDNADNLAMVEPFLPTKLPNGHLLLTTRATAMNGLAQPLALTSLEPEDGALCILRRAQYLGWNADLSDPSLSAPARSAALNLSELMGGLPLALEQAGAYIDTTGRGVSGYIKLYEQYRPEIQKNQYGTILYYRTAVAFAWNIVREVVQRESPAAIELLHLCAYLSPDAIPYELFPRDASILGSILGPVAANSLALDQALTPLRKYSLIKQQVDRDTDIPQIFIHRVLQEILRDGMDPETQRLWAERAVRVVALALPKVEWSIMQAHVQTCLLLIEQWKMSFREADTIRQFVEAKQI